MIELQWWVLLLAGLGVFFAGQVVGGAGLLKIATSYDKHQKKLNKRYPDNVH